MFGRKKIEKISLFLFFLILKIIKYGLNLF